MKKGNNKIPPEEKKLIRRYLIWCYKTTKETVDRVDRKITQLMIDQSLLKNLQAEASQMKGQDHTAFLKKMEEFKEYIHKKEEGLYADTHAEKRPEYIYQIKRLRAVEECINKFLGKKELQEIEESYQSEMTRRIWESREH